VKDEPEGSKKLSASETICVEQVWVEEFQDLSGTVRTYKEGVEMAEPCQYPQLADWDICLVAMLGLRGHQRTWLQSGHHLGRCLGQVKLRGHLEMK